MEWKDLSTTSANVLERCWGLYDDNPRTVKISINEKFKVWDEEYVFTEENYDEIVKYVGNRKAIKLERIGDQIIVSGVGQFGEIE